MVDTVKALQELTTAKAAIDSAIVALTAVVVQPDPPVVVDKTPRIEITAVPNTKNYLVKAFNITGKLKYTLVDNNDPNYTWLTDPPIEVDAPFIIEPKWTKNGQRYKVGNADWSVSKDTPVATGMVEPTVPAPTGGLAKARAFVRNQTIGINTERLDMFDETYKGSPLTKRPYYDYLYASGLRSNRFFPGYRYEYNMGWQGQPSMNMINAFLDGVQASMDAKLYTYLDFFDVAGAKELRENMAVARQYVNDFSRAIAERKMSDEWLAVGSVNEWADGTNNDFNDIRLDFDRIMTQHLPQHVKVHGAAYWNSTRGWTDGEWRAPVHDQWIGQVHAYIGPGVYNWTEQYNNVKRVAGVNPIVLTELGDDFNHMDYGQHSDRWVQLFEQVAREAPEFKFLPWAMTGDGHDFSLNVSPDDPSIQPKIIECLKRCDKIIRASPNFGK